MNGKINIVVSNVSIYRNNEYCCGLFMYLLRAAKLEHAKPKPYGDSGNTVDHRESLLTHQRYRLYCSRLGF